MARDLTRTSLAAVADALNEHPEPTAQIGLAPQEVRESHDAIKRLVGNIGRVVLGKDDIVKLVVAAILTRGHVLLEDKPGVGKTMLARALAHSIGRCTFKRIQCTPDLLPVDITGYIDPRSAAFKPGPLFAHIVLADELNRATPRTQSALLESMGEGQVSVEGATYLMPEPFFVLATQNPIEHRGVNDLPEAQLDRFQLMLTPGYPGAKEEKRVMLERQLRDPLDDLPAVMDADRLGALIALTRKVKLSEQIIDYILAIVHATRESEIIELGASPRCALHLMAAAQGHALVNGRGYVVPDDIKLLAQHVLPHRIIPAVTSNETLGSTEWKRECIRRIVAEVRPPSG